MSHFPPLDYSLSQRRKSISIAILAIFMINAGIPALVFYLLHYFTRFYPITVNGITSATFALGLLHLPLRIKQLLQNDGESSILPGSRRGAPAVQVDDASWFEQFDVFQWEFLFGTVFVAVFLIISCSINGAEGFFPFLALAPSILVAQVGIQFLAASVLSAVGFRLPFRLGSVPKGDVMRPAAYFVYEDIVAVDGGGGSAFRARMDARYRASLPFQIMLRILGFLMGGGAIALLGMECGIVFSGAGEEVIYGASLAVAVVWAAIGIFVARTYCVWAVRKEELWFAERDASMTEIAQTSDSIKTTS